MNFNKAIVIGNVTQDPESRSTPNGAQVANFSIATNRYWTDPQGQKQQSSEFHNCVAWSRLAEIAAQYLKKGSLVMIEGRLQTRSWEGQDGVKRYRTEIVVENMQLGPRSGQGGGGSTGYGNQAPPAASEDSIPTIQQDEIDTPPASKKSGNDSINVDDIPF